MATIELSRIESEGAAVNELPGSGDEITALVFQLAGELANQIGRDVAPLDLTQPQAHLIRELREACRCGPRPAGSIAMPRT